MNTLQMLYVCFLFLSLTVSIYEANVLNIENEKLKDKNKEKDVKLLGILYNIKSFTDCSETYNKEIVRNYVDLEITELIKENVKKGV